MVDIQKLKPAWFDHRTDVPQWIAAGIGQVVVEWSVLERETEELIRTLTDDDIQQARIVLNRMNVRTRMSTATALVQSHILQDKLKPSHRTRLVKLSKKIDAVQTKRDMLAHGLWGVYNRDWHVLKLRQSRPTPELRPTFENLSRAVLPQRERITRTKLRSICRQIASLAKTLEALCNHLQSALAPLQHKPPTYTRRRRDYRLRPKRKTV